MAEIKLLPDYLFEVSWEVCNKVGGIYTVISTKAKSIVDDLKDNYILIGPDVWKETHHNTEFIEDKFLFKTWRRQAEIEGHKFKIGRWDIAGSPVVILVDFTPYFSQKDKIFYDFWENYHLDSLHGQWDYMEPTLFGYAAAKLIESFYEFSHTSKDRIIAHFHEWMTGSGILYLKKEVPQIGTLFTTHATTVGRSIAGNGLPLYRDLEKYNANELAEKFNIQSKQSLEMLSANNCDAFTVVSEITDRECIQFHNKKADVITPNGFEDSFVPLDCDFEEKRQVARNKLFNVTEALLNQEIDRNSLLIINSGRYEFRNKGIDLFIDSMAEINDNPDFKKQIVAYITVPANHAGPRTELIERIHNCDFNNPISHEYLTHNLHDFEYDPILKRIKEKNLNNGPNDKVKIIFVPCYFNGVDGVFNLPYYDLLIGFDLSVFPSYYEPWGYTPLESVAFHIPTVTTTLAGFGLWIKQQGDERGDGIKVIERDDFNQDEVFHKIAKFILEYDSKSESEIASARQIAYEISQTVLWKNLIAYYHEAYHVALTKAELRIEDYKHKQLPEGLKSLKNIDTVKPAWKKVFIKSFIPESLFNLQKLSKNLWWSWNYDAHELFEMIDSQLWEEVGHNPIVLLESITLEKYRELEKDQMFLEKLNRVNSAFDEYMKSKHTTNDKQIGYFSMEFGLHDTLKIYSGGLGILAGDYLKQASDSGANIVGIGLLYRYGYFAQSLSVSGEQIANYVPQRFTALPLHPVRNEKGEWVIINLPMPGRLLHAKVWRVDVGRVPLYLLDADIEENSDADKSITYQLYGGDLEHRLKQEILLGIGGIKMLDAIGIKPEIYHCNEGHAAFIGLERLRKCVELRRMNFYEALEVVRASSLFTTHTPVPAGHDAFREDMIRTYLSYFTDKLNISWETLMGLGRVREDDIKETFSMSVLACKFSQEVNGVSKIHGKVSRTMFNPLWSDYFPQELHVGYVTNGVHFPTWVAKPWWGLYNEYLPKEFINDQSNKNSWSAINKVPDEKIWEVRSQLRQELFVTIRKKLMEGLENRQENPTLVLETVERLNENALTIGFARRFATYKRAHLIFSNLKRLAELVNNKEKPVQFIFAGKAHPADKAGQDLIKKIVEISRLPEFVGKILFLDNYDIELAKKLVQGVDVWLNTPTRPLEASGTSGEKAVMNGVVNCSVLDGWWAEGYVKGAGWALKEERTYDNQNFQDELDAETLYFLFENEIVPTFYNNDKSGLPTKWIAHIKKTIADIVPRFTMKRQLDDYYSKYYNKLLERRSLLFENNFEMVRKIAAWKQKMIRGWESVEIVSVDCHDSTQKPLLLGEDFVAEIVLNLHEIPTSDIGIEIVFGQKVFDEVKEIHFIEEMKPIAEHGGVVTFKCVVPATRSGVYDYSFRVFPKNHDLPHRMDFPLVKWI
ncbi:MAG: alpha-glucan family phosphorylase [Bacteroidia bacterium]|nr:alpha-glucan family phosphorylase [Bacteroidia bacterium]